MDLSNDDYNDDTEDNRKAQGTVDITQSAQRVDFRRISECRVVLRASSDTYRKCNLTHRLVVFRFCLRKTY